MSEKRKKLNKMNSQEQERIQKTLIMKGLKDFSEHTGLPINLLVRNLDEEKIKSFYEEVMEKHKDKGDYNPYEDSDFKEKFVEYVSDGEILNDKMNNYVNVDDKGNYSIKERLVNLLKGGPKDLDIKENNKKLSGLMALVSSDPAYRKLTPELVESLGKANKLVYAKNIINVALADGLLDKREYRSLAGKVYEASEKHNKEIPMHIRDYIEKSVASIIGLFGIGVLLTQTKITGAVVGTGISFSDALFSGLGLGLIALAILGTRKLRDKDEISIKS